MSKLRTALASVSIVAAACSSPSTSDDASGRDATASDAHAADAGASDAPPADALASDAGPPDAAPADAEPPVSPVGPPLVEHSDVIFTDGCPIAMAVTSTGVPVVAYRRADGSNPLAVARYYQGRWAELPGPVNTSTIESNRCWALGVEADGTPELAFDQRTPNPDVFAKLVRRWNGSSWATMGAAFGVTYYDPNLDLVIDPQGRSVLVTTSTGSIQVARYDPAMGNWALLGARFFRVQPYAGSMRLGLQASGEPMLLWAEGTGGSNARALYVSRWDGAAWQSLGGVIDSVPNATQLLGDPALAIDGMPMVVYAKNPGQTQLHLKRFDGAAWNEVSFPDNAGADYSRPGFLALAGGGVALAWNDSQGGPVNFARLDGSTWSATIDAKGGTPARPAFPTLAQGAGALFLAHHGLSNAAHVVRIVLP